MYSKKEILAEYLRTDINNIKELPSESTLFKYFTDTYEVLDGDEMEDRFKSWCSSYARELCVGFNKIDPNLTNYIDWDGYFSDLEYTDIEDFVSYMPHKGTNYYYIQRA